MVGLFFIAMKQLSILPLFLLLFLCSCQPSVTKTWSCTEDSSITIPTPDGTYHLSLSVIKSCNSGSIFLYENGVPFNLEYTLENVSDNKVIYEGDWYIGDLGIQYVSDGNATKGDMEIRATFYHR